MTIDPGQRGAGLARARAWIGAHGPAFAVEALVNFVGPYLIYDLARPHLGDVKALMASSGPPIAWSLIEFARRRRIDAVSLLVLTGIALSLLAFAGGGGVKFLQLREKLVNVLIGAIFLGSAAIGKPLIYELSRATLTRRSAADAQAFVALRDNIYFRRSMMVMTLVWGVGLMLEGVLGGLLVFTVSVRQYLIVSPILGNSAYGLLGLWTFLYVRKRRALGAARRAAEAAAEAAAKD